MTDLEHGRQGAKEYIEWQEHLRDTLIAAAHALFDVLTYDAQHSINCTHNVVSIETLEEAQNEKELIEDQLTAFRTLLDQTPEDQKDLLTTTMIRPLENKLKKVEEDISEIQAELERA